MSLHFTTSSGSHYEIDTAQADGEVSQFIRRVNPDAGKRADGDWVRLYRHFPNPIQEGLHLLLEMESLHEYGPDDHDPHITIRTTTEVTRVWREGEN